MTNTKQAVLEERMKNLEATNKEEHREILRRINEICLKLDTKFVTQDRFGIVEKLVYGMVAVGGSFFIGYAFRVILSHQL